MSNPLAIFTPAIGARSETFIRRHAQDLLPGRTVVVATTKAGCDLEGWNANGSALVLSEILETVGDKFVRSVAQGVGLGQPNTTVRSAERFLKTNKVQVMLGEYLDKSLVWFPLARKLGIRFYAHAHGYDVSLKLRDDRWRSSYLQYNESDGIITMSRASAARLIDLGLTKSKIHIIPYGVNVPTGPRNRAENEIVRCLAVGRMVAKKAPILMLDAFRRAAEACPNLHLDYVGTGPLLPAVRQFVQAFNLGNRVTLHGGQPNEVVHQLLATADIFVQHSMTDPETGDEEGLPVAILEAMAQSVPVVSTNHAGIPEAVVDDLTDYLVERIVALKDANLRALMGTAGWQRAKECFTWEKERLSLLRVMGLQES